MPLRKTPRDAGLSKSYRLGCPYQYQIGQGAKDKAQQKKSNRIKNA
jgi:hypothetical protein